MCLLATLRGFALAGLLVAASSAAASGLQIAPTGLSLTVGGPAGALWLTNTGDKELRAQVRAYTWSQASGKDVLDPTQAVVASPPMLSIPPGGKQLVRVIRTGPASAGGEQSFRLLVDELPLDTKSAQTGVQYVLRYSVPVFIGTPDGTPALTWSATLGKDGLGLDVHNASAMHAQLSALHLDTPNAAPVPLAAGLLGYVLPGATMHWTLPVPAGTDLSHATLKALVNGESTDQTLAPGAPAR
jgi:fimbrial chaperone protein